jgi:hypothetical protein
VRWQAIATALVAAAALGGCSAQSNQRVTSESIVVVPRDMNLILDGTFATGGTPPWYTTVPSAGSYRRVDLAGQRSLQISVPRRAPGVVILAQDTDFLPDHRAGSTYLLTVDIRAVRSSQPVTTELRLNYVGGGYGFFIGRPTATSPGAGVPSAIVGTTHGWVTVQARAMAQLPLVSIDAFVLDSGSGGFSGTVWTKDVSLRDLG